MDKVAERETQDFMNVESFSQLPFIRPAPQPNKEKAIRLFGIEFAADAATATDDSELLDNYTNACEDSVKGTTTTPSKDKNSENNSESNRRFECHYCCRNFPTSQALGGHQNAHKRERQHAKREHLQSAVMHGHDAHNVYGLMNYTRLGSTAHHHHHQYHHHQPTTYPSWNITSSSNSPSTARFYGSSGGAYGTQSAPINGSPLGLWRIPAVQGASNTTTGGNINVNPSFNRDRSINLFTADGEEMRTAAGVSIGGGPSGGRQGQYAYDSSMGSVQDHVSLDLHL